MVRKCFYSFHYKKDNWRASLVRNIGVIEGNRPVNDNAWEEVKRGDDQAIKKWIDNQMKGRSCTIILAGEKTANRKWINYEIEQSWKEGMGVVGIRIHGLKDRYGEISPKGADPFDYVTDTVGQKLSSFVHCHDPPRSSSEERYAWIADNIARLVDEAIIGRSNVERLPGASS